MDQIAGFPKNLAFNLKRVQGALVKQRITISSDKSEYKPNERVMVNLPIGRMIDTRSICATAKCRAGTGNHFPRGGLNSLIENMQVTVNSRVVQSTQSYNYIWNALADVSGYFSQDQAPKRLYENFDPSLAHTNVNGIAAPVITNNATTVAGNEEYYFAISSFLGFFSSSAPTLNTNDLGLIQVIWTLAPNSACWVGAGAAGTAVASADYTVSNFNLSMDTVTFTNSIYHDLVKTQLESDGLNVAYNDYLISVGSLITKSTSQLTHTAQFSSDSLDMVIGTFRHKDYNTISGLLLADAVYSATSATIVGATKTFPLTYSNPVTNEDNHGGFNNSVFYQRCGGAIDATSWYINSQPFTVNSSPVQIFNGTLQALDYSGADIASGGLHAGALTTGFYNKNYFVDILSLENLSGDNQNWVSGLSSNGGTTQVQYNFRFTGASVENEVYPIIIAKVTKQMNIKIGRNIDIRE